MTSTTGAHTLPRPNIAAEHVPERLSTQEVRRGLRLSIVEGLFANVHVSVTTGAFLTGFALLLGASPFELGLISAIPFVGQLFQLAGAYLEQRLGERRRTATLLALGSRATWAFFALLPFLDGLGALRMPVFLVTLAIAQVMYSIAGNAWLSWMSDLVPPRQRGRYFGVRNTALGLSAMVSTWLAGRALDGFTAAGDARTGYLLIFGIAVGFACAAALVLWRQPEPPIAPQPRVSPREMLSAPLRHRRFGALSRAAVAWALVTGISAPFFNAYGLQTLQLSYATLALMTVATSAVALIAQPMIGRLQDRLGDQRVLVASTVGVVLLPWGWVLSTPDFLLPLWLTSIFSGVFWPGITQGLVNLMMDRAPAEGRAAYVAAFGALTGAGTFLAGLLGGVLATWIGPSLIHIGPIALNQYAVLFVLSSLGRAGMALVFARRV